MARAIKGEHYVSIVEGDDYGNVEVTSTKDADQDRTTLACN